MYFGYKLDSIRAKVALGFLAMSFSHPLFALGLSEINVNSNLGEPLNASITVFGASELKSENCLALGPSSQLQQVKFVLSPLTNDSAKLTLTSQNIINEPIVNLSIIAGCDNLIERNYVLLLDPPITANSLQQTNLVVEALSTTELTNNDIKNSPIDSKIQQPSVLAKEQPKKKRTERRTASNQASKKQTGNQATAKGVQNNTKNTAQKKNNNTSNANEPRLFISGQLSVPTISEAKLRLDKQLNLTPNAYQGNIPTSEEMLLEDEMTVVNNRISHLKNQIDQLKSQNTKLTSDNSLKTTQLAQTHSKQNKLINLLVFISAILLLILAYIVFTWLRKRQIQKQADDAEALWLSVNNQDINQTAEEPISTDKKSELEDKINKVEEIEEDTLPPAPVGSLFKSAVNEEQPIVIEDEQIFSVLDHADVFLFHGRANLAIQLLQNYLVEHPKQSVTIWLFLLDLLAKENLVDLYKQTEKDCKLYYNINIPDLSQEPTDAVESLEDFPRLVQGLAQVWGTANAMTYLDDLIYNNRPTPREGLPRNLIEELTLLKGIAQDNQQSVNQPQSTTVPPVNTDKLTETEEKEALFEKIKTKKQANTNKSSEITTDKDKQDKQDKQDKGDKGEGFEFTLIDQ